MSGESVSSVAAEPLVVTAASGDSAIVYLATLQLHWGGLFDGSPHDGLVHLVRGSLRGTPGPLLCGIDRFAEGSPGFSVGGGISGPSIEQRPCPGCVETARRDFAGLPVAGMLAAAVPIAEAIGTEVVAHSMDVPAIRADRTAREAARQATRVTAPEGSS